MGIFMMFVSYWMSVIGSLICSTRALSLNLIKFREINKGAFPDLFSGVWLKVVIYLPGEEQ
jgi:hypothetical protein